MFNIPEGYTCVVRQSDTQLYAYKNNIRDIYQLNGFKWQKISTNTNSSISSSSICVQGRQIPSSLVPSFILGALLIVLAFFKIILNMFMGVRR